MRIWSDEYKQWLASLKVGDSWQAIQPRRYGAADIVTFRITGETPARWKIVRGAGVFEEVYKKDNGRIVGSDSAFDLLPPATDAELSALREEHANERAVRTAETAQWRKLPIETVKAVAVLLTQLKGNAL